MIDKEDVVKILKNLLSQAEQDHHGVIGVPSPNINQVAQQICDPDKPLDRDKLKEKIAEHYWIRWRDDCHYPGYCEKDWGTLVSAVNDESSQMCVEISRDFADEILALIPDKPKGRDVSDWGLFYKPQCSRCSEKAEWVGIDKENLCQIHWEEYCSEQWFETRGGLVKPDESRLLTDITNSITGFGCGVIASWDGCGNCEGLKDGEICQGATEIAKEIISTTSSIKDAECRKQVHLKKEEE